MKAWLQWTEEGMRVPEGPGAWASAQCRALAPGLLVAWVVLAQELTAVSAGFFLVSGT